MLSFLKTRSYEIVRLFGNQIAFSIFGFALMFASKKPGLSIGTSIFSVLFYLVVTYVLMWEMGAKESHKIQNGAEGHSPLAGLYMGLAASAINFLLAILITLGTFIRTTFFGNIGGVAKTIALLVEGMYNGILSAQVGGTPLHNQWFMYLLTPLPLIAVTAIAYYAGTKNFRIFGKKKA